MTRQWDDTWQTLAYHAKNPEYPLNDELLKELILKLYYNNYKHLIIEKKGYESDLKRKLIKTIIHGDYTPEAVSYAVQGSPPKGTIFVFEPKFKRDIYLYDNGKMKKMMSEKYLGASNLFFEDACNELNKLSETKTKSEEEK